MELLIMLLALWMISPIVLGVALLISRRKRRRAEAATAEHETAAAGPARPGDGVGELAPRDVTSLLLLQLELRQQVAAGGLDGDEHEGLARSLDAVWARQLERAGFEPDSGKWRSRRDEAWNVFVRQQGEPPGQPPWRSGAPESDELEWLELELPDAPAEPTAEPPSTAAARRAPAARTLRAASAAAPAEPQRPATPVAGAPAPAEGETASPARPGQWQPASPPAAAPLPTRSVTPQPPAPAEPAGTGAFAFEPAEPSALGKVIETVSGWPKLAAPFLIQNVGWFIGGFCFVAGTLFLLSVTTGYVNALVILASLAVYTGFLLWAGYAIRRKSPELRTSGNVLLTIGMLLAPLNLTAGVHLVSAGVGSMPALALGIVLAASQCVGILVAARLVNALMDRALPARHAQLFAALCALQLAAPLVAWTDHWLWVAAAHAATLALVAWGLLAFAGDWIRSIFLDRRLIAYYAAGLLVFAAVVSFVQLARAYPAPLPPGYLGPYLMALCAMLFYVDATLKEWTKKHPFLSRFTFGLYGLSVLALLLCFNAPVPRTVSLVLAVATYGQVLWRYSSVPALYLLLAAFGWLYGSIALEPLAREYHLLASLPGLAGLFALMRWAERRSVALATVCLRAFGLAFVGLTAWSLFHGEPGPAAFATGAAATVGVFYALSSAPWLLRASFDGDARDAVINPAPWYYAVAALAAVTLAYAPALPWLSWSNQLAFALLGLASVAVWIALRLRAGASTVRTEASLNSALVLIAAAVLLGAGAAAARFPLTPTLALLLMLAGCLTAWLSIELGARWMFYGVLAALGVTALIVKRTYFPAPSYGTGELVGVLAIWVLVWWLDRRQDEADAWADEAPGNDEPTPAPMRVLWWIPVARAASLAEGVANR
jgi:hypothetical protein